MMIGAFARKLGPQDHPAGTDYEKLTDATAGAPPERFVERFPHDGGDVFFAPMLETLRAVLSRVRATPAASDAKTTQPDTIPCVSENS